MRNINGLKKNSEFQRVYGKRKSYANSYLIMYIAPNHSEVSKIGISASKKIGNSIVRHHVSRLIREAYRLNKEQLAGGFDIVIVARPAAATAGFHEIQDSYVKLLGRHHILLKKEKQADTGE
jgi:ribonuclease P protein component